MEEPLYLDTQEPGLFTFYMSDNKQNYFENQARQEPQPKLDPQLDANNRRKQRNQSNSPSHLIQPQETVEELRQRQQKLNKFLINCVGAKRRLKSIQGTEAACSSKRHTEPIPLLHFKQKESPTMLYPNIKISSHRKKDSPGENRSSTTINNKNQNCRLEIKQKIQLKIPKEEKNDSVYDKQKQNKSYRNGAGNYSIVNLYIEHKSRQSRSHSQQNSNKQTQKTVRNQQRLKKLTINSKNEVEQKPENKTKKGHTEGHSNEEYLLKQKLSSLDKMGNLSELYPRLIKHHSEQLCITPSPPNQMGIISIPPALSKSSNKKIQSFQRAFQSGNQTKSINMIENVGLELDSNQINKLKNSTPATLRLPNIKLPKENHNQINSNETKPVSNHTNNLKNIYMAEISSNIQKEQAKRKHRLEQIYKNRKMELGLQIGLMLNQNHTQIEELRKINQVYYSIDNRQKKALQINFGAQSKDRIFDGFQERKKVLIEKLNEYSDRKMERMLKASQKEAPKRRKSKLKLRENKKIL